MKLLTFSMNFVKRFKFAASRKTPDAIPIFFIISNVLQKFEPLKDAAVHI